MGFAGIVGVPTIAFNIIVFVLIVPANARFLVIVGIIYLLLDLQEIRDHVLQWKHVFDHLNDLGLDHGVHLVVVLFSDVVLISIEHQLRF